MQERSEVHKVGVDTIALHPSQALVATGGADRLIKLWPHQSQVSTETLEQSQVKTLICYLLLASIKIWYWRHLDWRYLTTHGRPSSDPAHIMLPHKVQIRCAACNCCT